MRLLLAGEDATVAPEEFVLSQLTVSADTAAFNFPHALSELTVLSAGRGG
jgi:hypothetical protein